LGLGTPTVDGTLGYSHLFRLHLIFCNYNPD